MNCIVCYEQVDKVIEFICSHSICQECLKKWFHVQITCPLCRTIIEPKLLPNTRSNFQKNKQNIILFLQLLVDNEEGVWLKRGIYIYEFLNENSYLLYSSPEISKVISDQDKEISEVLVPITKDGKRMLKLIETSNQLCKIYSNQ